MAFMDAFFGGGIEQGLDRTRDEWGQSYKHFFSQEGTRQAMDAALLGLEEADELIGAEKGFEGDIAQAIRGEQAAQLNQESASMGLLARGSEMAGMARASGNLMAQSRGASLQRKSQLLSLRQQAIQGMNTVTSGAPGFSDIMATMSARQSEKAQMMQQGMSRMFEFAGGFPDWMTAMKGMGSPGAAGSRIQFPTP